MRTQPLQVLKAKVIYPLGLCLTILLQQCQSETDRKISDSLSNHALMIQDQPEEVSLVSLNISPNKYNGKLVRVKGFLQLSFEGNLIFPNKKEYDQRVDSNCLSIDITRKQMDSTYSHLNKMNVAIDGVFDKNDKGHMNGYKGSITKISKIEAIQ